MVSGAIVRAVRRGARGVGVGRGCRGMLAAGLAAVAGAGMAGLAGAQVVTSTADSGPGSLRAAIEAANQGGGGTITFSIPESDPGFSPPGSPGAWRITVASALPPLSAAITVDALTQPGAACAGPKVELRPLAGAGGAATGLVLGADDCAVRGLAIGGFSGDGVLIAGIRRGQVGCCFIGTDAAGTGAVGNGTGVRIRDGVACAVGAFEPGRENTIAFNTGAGVAVVSTMRPSNTGSTIARNSIHDNGALGIDLAEDGPTPNDPLDLDTGPNHLQNFPVITGFSGGVISGTLGSLPDRLFRIEVFASAAVDPSGFGEGLRFVDAVQVMTGMDGSASFTLPYTARPGDRFISATATALPPPVLLDPGMDPRELDLRGVSPPPPTGTSEFSPAFVIAPPANTPPVAAGQTVTTPEDTDVTVTLAASDADGDALTLRIGTPPARGQVLRFGTLAPIGAGGDVGDAQGRVVYRPPPDENGSPLTSFTFIARDGQADSEPATVTVNVTPVNDPPAAADDAYATDEDTALVVGVARGVLVNDTDTDGDALSAVLVAGVSHGALSLNADGTFAYTPAPDYHGTDTFTYRASDGRAQSNVATVMITVRPVNDPPAAADDAYATDEDVALVVAGAAGVLANDTDADGDALTAVPVTGPAHGTVALRADGGFTYTPSANYNGPDGFTYRAFDGAALSEPARVVITVRAVNDPPAAADDAYAGEEDTQLVVGSASAGVLANDTDVDGDALTAALLAAPSHGSVTLNGDGTFVYTPAANYHGADSFTYRASDGRASSNPATVRITLVAVNDPPVALDDSYQTDEDTTLVVSAAAQGVLANDTDVDGDALTAAVQTPPSHGALSLNADGTLTYTPASDFNGEDVFTYRASDGRAQSAPATVRVMVQPVNDPPVAVDDAYATDEDTPLTVSTRALGVLGNDTDVDSPQASLTAVLVSTTTRGTLTFNANGTFTYSPQPNFNGTDSFTYRASDGQATSSIATATITVRAVNDPPVARNDSYFTDEDTPLTVAPPGVLLNDSDVDDDVNTLTVTIVTGPASGTLANVSGGGFRYTPSPNFNGDDSFTYRLSDGRASSNLATVTVQVRPLNDPPVANADVYSTPEDTALTVAAPGVLANDTDPDSPASALTAQVVQPPAVGTLALQPTGAFVYTPPADFNGPVTFTYRVSDGSAVSDPATVSITVTPVNDPPVAADDAYAIDQDATLTVTAAAGVLANDTDPDGPASALRAAVAAGPAHGMLALAPDGGFTYTPAPGFSGPDSFTYRASDGQTDSNPATVRIQVRAQGNLPPVARCRDVTIDARRSCPASFSVTAEQVNNGSSDPDDPADSLRLALSNTGPFRLGSTPVTLTVTDPHGASDACTATVTVLGDDCDGNGVPDACDIASGAAADCNHDGVPDSCQCVWDNGMAPAGADGQYAQFGGFNKLAGKVADDFYIEPGQVCHITSFSGQIITNLAPALRRARVEFYNDCNGMPAGDPIAVFDNSVVAAVAARPGGSSMVTFSFDLCSANLWLDGGKAYWVSLYALVNCGDRSSSYWAFADGPINGAVPRAKRGHTAITSCTTVQWEDWLQTDICCGRCDNMAFKIGGAKCPIIWDNGPYWHCPGGGGLPSGMFSGRQQRAADNFVVKPCEDQSVCFIEATIWTSASPQTGFVEIYDNACRRPTSRLFTAPVTQVIPLNETIRIGTVDVTAYTLRFTGMNWTLRAGQTYWLAAGATGAGGSNAARSYFATAIRCETDCRVAISPAWTGPVNLGGSVLWASSGTQTDLAFRVGATPGVRVPAAAAGASMPACPVDIDGDGQVGVQDLFTFLQSWFAGCP